MLIQRGISARTKGITDYLLKWTHRFLGGIVVAAWGGEPKYTAMSMEDPDGMLQGLDREFGVLTFDGSQQYFVLDGQHRLPRDQGRHEAEPGHRQGRHLRTYRHTLEHARRATTDTQAFFRTSTEMQNRPELRRMSHWMRTMVSPF